MEKFQESREKALRNLKIADHMVSTTYPLLKDNKLLLNAAENVFLSLSHGMNAILYYDRLFKRIPPYSDTFEIKFNILKTKCAKRYELDAGHIRLLLDLREILVLHRKSPMEFSRKDKFIICSDDYQMKTITHADLKAYVAKAKVFIRTMVRIVQQNEGIFRGG